MANLRKEARGREYQVRIYGICNGNPETRRRDQDAGDTAEGGED